MLQTLCGRYGIGRRGANTGTSASAITADAMLGGPGSAEDLDVGHRILIDSGAARAGDETALSSKPRLTTGVANVDPNFGAALSSGDTFIAFRDRRFRWVGGGDSLVEQLNAVLSLVPVEMRRVPITLVTDGDMLASGTTSWSEVGSGALSKVAATFPLGHRVLRMTGVAADDYILSATIPVEEGATYYLEVLGMLSSTAAAADQGTLVLRDNTNSANITLDETTIDRFEPELLVNPAVSMPSGCEQVAVRFEADNAGDVVDLAWVIFRKNDLRRFVLADRPQRPLRIGKLLVRTASEWAESPDWREVSYSVEELDAGVWAIESHESLAGLSVWYEEFTRPGLFTIGAQGGAGSLTMTETTAVPLDDLCAAVAERFLRPYQDDRRWQQQYARAARDAAGALERLIGQHRTVVTKLPPAPITRRY